MKKRFNLEYQFGTIPQMILWNYVATASGLSQWFADSVSANGKNFTFVWDKSESAAVQLSSRTGVSIKFRWSDDEDGNYFEFRLTVSELTDMTQLSITDFDYEDEVDESIELWNVQIKKLQRILGC